jgi:DnaJ-class molecular chaperone
MKWRNLGKRQDIIEEYKNKNPYEVLEVPPSASMKEIKRAYRMITKRYHPDVSDDFLKKTNEEITKFINIAYESILRERSGQR